MDEYSEKKCKTIYYWLIFISLPKYNLIALILSLEIATFRASPSNFGSFLLAIYVRVHE